MRKSQLPGSGGGGKTFFSGKRRDGLISELKQGGPEQQVGIEKGCQVRHAQQGAGEHACASCRKRGRERS